MIMYYGDLIKGESIKNGEEKSFIVDLSDIFGISIRNIGFYDKQFSYLYSYPLSEDEGKSIILDVQEENGMFYLKPRFADYKILLISEDCLVGCDAYDDEYEDEDEDVIDTVRLSGDRINYILHGSYGLSNSLPSNQDVLFSLNEKGVLDNPLGVYLSRLTPVSSISDSKMRNIIAYNSMASSQLSSEIALMYFKAKENIDDEYEEIFGDLKINSKKH